MILCRSAALCIWYTHLFCQSESTEVRSQSFSARKRGYISAQGTFHTDFDDPSSTNQLLPVSVNIKADSDGSEYVVSRTNPDNVENWSSVGDESEDFDQCQAPSVNDTKNEILRSIVKAMHNFSVQENLLIYPTVLTAVAALRYGSVTTIIDRKKYTIDHDIDFMIVMPQPPSILQVEDVCQKASAHLSKSGLKTRRLPMGISKMAMTDARFKWMRQWVDSNFIVRTVRHKYYITFLAVHKETHLTQKEKESGIHHRIVEKRYFQYWKSNASGLPRYLRRGKVMGGSKGVTKLNLWLPIQPDASHQPSSSSKVLFMGEQFPFPSFHAMLHALRDEFDDFHPASNATICDFSYPNGLFEEDVPEADAHKKLHAQKCARELNISGFVSFHECFL